MRKFVIYRNGPTTCAARLDAAITHYLASHAGQMPAAVVVNPQDVESATAALAALDVALPVGASGGVMSVEVWLQVAEVT